jgi:hypothetical protein
MRGARLLNRDRALAELRGCSSEVRAHGVRALYLFGSTARDAAGDIDGSESSKALAIKVPEMFAARY